MTELTEDQKRVAKFAVRTLTPRECQVLEKLSLGWGQPAIARKLGIAGKTISTYKSRLLIKLDCRNDVELVHFALKYGIVANLFDE